MGLRNPRSRSAGALGGALGLALVLGACGGGDEGGGGGGGGGGGNAAGGADCAAFESYGDLSGKTVTIYTSITAPEDEPHKESYKPFEDCTGATVKYEGSKEFEAQLPVRVKSGNPPDLAYIPQPGLLQTLVATGKVVKAPAEVEAKDD